MERTRSSVAIAVAIFIAVSMLIVPSDASGRSEGNQWVYSVTTEVEGIQASGTLRYESMGESSIVVNWVSHEVNVVKVTGSVWGVVERDDVSSRSVEAVFDGFVYEFGFAAMKEEMYTWVNETVGTDSMAMVTRTEVWDVTTYSGPVLGGFDGVSLGREWNATPLVTASSTVWVDDALVNTSASESAEAWSCSVAASTVPITTGAGEFECLELMATDDEGYREVYWYSSEACRFVKVSMFAPDEPLPYMDMELSEYSLSESWETVIIVAGLLAIVVVAAVIVLLVIRSRGRRPTQ